MPFGRETEEAEAVISGTDASAAGALGSWRGSMGQERRPCSNSLTLKRDGRSTGGNYSGLCEWWRYSVRGWRAECCCWRPTTWRQRARRPGGRRRPPTCRSSFAGWWTSVSVTGRW
eukprot:2962514-Prymnesium_polylepis.1